MFAQLFTGLLSWWTPIVILALYGLLRFAVRDSKQEKNSINWPPLESIGITLFIYFAGQLVGGLLVYLPLVALGWDEKRITAWLSNNTLGQFLAVLAIEAISVWLLVSFLRRRKSKLSAIGIVGKPSFGDFGRALGGYAIYFVLYLMVIWAAKTLVPSLNLDQKQDIGFDDVAQFQLPLVFVSLVVLPPIVEELLMRGFLYTSLRNKWPKFYAVVATSALFAVAHLQAGRSAPLLWVAALDTFVLSIVLIHLREKTGKLWASMMLHAIKNCVAFAALFLIAK